MPSGHAHPGADPDPTSRLAVAGDPGTGATAKRESPVGLPDLANLTGFGPPSGSDVFPQPGERLLHFELVEELGRGAFARVYLAKQESLANRLVALKVTTTPTDEPQKLARLQHPNVVPVYSVHQAPPFHVLCMPFLGRVTLCRVIARLASKGGTPPTSGRELLSSLVPDSRSPSCSTDTPVPFAGRPNPLARLSFVEAGLWVVGRLAAGLAHAHERGILHRDLKPANVLVTPDGTPMLLDFNVSSESARGHHRPGRSGRVGGTLPYMAPEHLRAFIGEEVEVDERSDLYSLGVILYELLTGRLPFPSRSASGPVALVATMIEQRKQPPDSPRRLNPAIGPAAAAIVAKLLAANPADRYARADDLRDDLTRQLEHRPLRFAPNPSVVEQAAKWRRRHPRLATGLVVAAAALAFLVLPVAGYAAHSWDARRRAEAERVATAAENARLEAEAREAERARAVVGFHAAAADLETASVMLASRADPALREQGRTLANDVIARYGLATDPDWRGRPAFARLDPAEQDRLKAALAEALILMTRAEPTEATALRWNELAAHLFPPEARPAVLTRHRVELEARRDGKPVPPLAPDPVARETDLYFDGLDLAAAGRYRDAMPLLTRFTEQKPTHFRGWFARGLCHDALGQPADAAAAFGVCVALRPDFPHAHLNRGVARLRLRRFADAEHDCTRALVLKPNWTAALLNRGLARDGQRKFADAEADYTAALVLPTAPTRLYFLRSAARGGQGFAFRSAADWVAGMTREPADALSYGSRGKRWMDAGQWDRAGADFDAALKLNPTMRDALLDKAIVLGDGLHREAEAVPVLDRLLELYPTDIEARAGRGVYLARLGRAADARRDAEAVLKADQSAFRLYQMAGLFAQLSKADPKAKDEALRLFGRSLRAGFADWRMIADDPDIAPIRDDPAFKALLAAAAQLDRGK